MININFKVNKLHQQVIFAQENVRSACAFKTHHSASNMGCFEWLSACCMWFLRCSGSALYTVVWVLSFLLVFCSGFVGKKTPVTTAIDATDL